MSRRILQFRPRHNPDGPAYSPQRDIAHIYAPMLQEVFQGLDEENWSPYFRSWFEREGLTQDDLCGAVAIFLEAHRLFIRDREVGSPADAFAKAGEIPTPVWLALFARLGEVFMGGFFVGLRDVTYSGQSSNAEADFSEMLAAGRELTYRLAGKPLPHYEVTEITSLQSRLAEQNRVNIQATEMIAERDRKIAELTSQVAAMMSQPGSTEDT